MKARRSTKPHQCGQCESAFRWPHGLKRHIDSCHNGVVYRCHCGKTYTQKTNLFRHQREKHEAPARTSPPLAAPQWVSSKGIRAAEWYFVKDMVNNCHRTDRDKFGSTPLCNEQRHALAESIMRIVCDRDLRSPTGVDDMGGSGLGLLLQPHALMKLSLDRIDNNKTHFDFEEQDPLLNL